MLAQYVWHRQPFEQGDHGAEGATLSAFTGGVLTCPVRGRLARGAKGGGHGNLPSATPTPKKRDNPTSVTSVNRPDFEQIG